MSEPKINYLGPASEAAIATLQHLGYMYNGGQQWKPPVGTKPDFDLIDTLRAERDALQLRLNVADQRIDELEGLGALPSSGAYGVELPHQIWDNIHQHAFELGGTDDGNYDLTPEEINDLISVAVDLMRKPAELKADPATPA